MHDILDVRTPKPANDDHTPSKHEVLNEGPPSMWHDTAWFGREWTETEIVDDARILVPRPPSCAWSPW